MGTIVEITVAAENEKKADDAITSGFQEIRRLEEIMSTYKPESDISQVNASAGIKPVKVDKDLIIIVRKALGFAELSGGAFNIAIGPAIDLWKVTESDRIPSNRELDSVRPLIDYKNIIVNETAETIFLKKKGMRINLGGIGKGFAADYALNILKKHGINSGIIAVAGDLKVFGKKTDGTLWNIGITHPRKISGGTNDTLAKVHFTDMSISTSGDYERFFMKNGKRYHHILSPETLHPSVGFQSVSIIAKDSTTTDALSTAIFAMGPEKGIKLLESLPEIYGITVLEDGRIKMSSNLAGNNKLRVELLQ
ncbi:MAG: FAD:protein FMN transferase [Nitrospirae bacterium]|nr:FAD:protein FMN transferase [Nitrospirota bacterium]